MRSRLWYGLQNTRTADLYNKPFVHDTRYTNNISSVPAISSYTDNYVTTLRYVEYNNQLISSKNIRKQHIDEFQLFDLFFRRLISQLLGASILLIMQRQLASKLTVAELAFVWKLASRLLLSAAPAFQAQRLRESYPWRYGAMALYLSVTCRDTTLLVNWFQSRIANISLYQHQNYFRSLGFYLGQAVVNPNYGFALQGSCLKLSGKISVAGNSRTRSMLARYGKSGASCLEQRMTQSVFLVRSRTGCLGGTLQIFY